MHTKSVENPSSNCGHPSVSKSLDFVVRYFLICVNRRGNPSFAKLVLFNFFSQLNYSSLILIVY